MGRQRPHVAGRSESLPLRVDMSMGVVEVVGCVSKCIDLELGKQILWQLLEKPVEDQAAFDAALRVEDKDHFGILGVVQRLLDDAICHTNVGRGVVEVALDHALDHIEENARAAYIACERDVTGWNPKNKTRGYSPRFPQAPISLSSESLPVL